MGYFLAKYDKENSMKARQGLHKLSQRVPAQREPRGEAQGEQRSSRHCLQHSDSSSQQAPLASTRDLKTVNKNNLLVFLSLSINFEEILETTQCTRKENSVFLMLHGANAKMITDLLVKSCHSKGKVSATKQLRFNTSFSAQT